MPPKGEPKKASNSSITKSAINTKTKNSNGGIGSTETGPGPTSTKTDGNAPAEEKKPGPVKKKKPLWPIEVLLGESLMNASGETISPKRFVTENGVIGMYFGAKWCPPCRMMLPSLLLLYEEVKKAEKVKFEMIYVSFDQSKESFDENLGKMPWWAIPFENDELREDVVVKFNIRGIPMFILLEAKTLEIINRNCRMIVMIDPRGENFPWRGVEINSLTLPELLGASTSKRAEECTEEPCQEDGQATSAPEPQESEANDKDKDTVSDDPQDPEKATDKS